MGVKQVTEGALGAPDHLAVREKAAVLLIPSAPQPPKCCSSWIGWDPPDSEGGHPAGEGSLREGHSRGLEEDPQRPGFASTLPPPPPDLGQVTSPP